MGSSVSVSRPPSSAASQSLPMPASTTDITTQTTPPAPELPPQTNPVCTQLQAPSAITMPRKISVASLSPASSKKVDQNRINEERRKSVKPNDALSADTKDVMISYSHADTEMMKRIRAILESHGLTVWVDIAGLTAGVDFLAKIGQAIIDCKAFISLLSEKTISSRCCADELALAYVSNKPIYPIGLQTPQELLPLMDTGMRLQLARYDWFLLTNSATVDAQMDDFSTRLSLALRKDEEASAQKEGSPEKPSDVKKHPNLQRAKSVVQLDQTMDEDMLSTFWDRHFEEETSWESFRKAFNEEYSKPLRNLLQIKNTDWLHSLLHRELLVKYNDGKVLYHVYKEFCTVDGEVNTLWSRVQDQAIESYSMREVFNMNSTVRVEAIENLGRLRSKAVVEALMDLLEDQDNNVVTVAALSLAKTGDNSKEVINKLMECLESDDRLVRESGCLALGHLRAKEAVSKLVHLWRNDFISSVRDASNVALEQIGGEEASKAIHITNLLAKEIRSLTQNQ